MSEQKPRFKANGPEPSKQPNSAGYETKANQPAKVRRKETGAVWIKETTEGETYLNIKVTLPDGKEMWLKAFKNKFKKPDETHKPEYVAYENKGNSNAT